MLKKTVFAGFVLALGFLMPLYAMAEGTSTGNTSPLTNQSPVGTLNPNNMGQTDITNPSGTGTTYTGTESIKGYDPNKGNGHYDMSGTGMNDMNTIRTNNYRTNATNANGNNWGWLGLLGLLGLSGLFGRGRNEDRDPV
jgi:hypothetical protein